MSQEERQQGISGWRKDSKTVEKEISSHWRKTTMAQVSCYHNAAFGFYQSISMKTSASGQSPLSFLHFLPDTTIQRTHACLSSSFGTFSTTLQKSWHNV